MKRAIYFWQKGIWAFFSIIVVLILSSGFLYIYLEGQLPDVTSLNTVQLQVPLRIYTQDGKLIQEYGEKRRLPLVYADIPPMLVHALLVTEDQRFFEHSGVDIFGLGRATLKMITTGTKSQGGSTITMQVARNFFLSRKKTFLRKFNEILLAIKIDRELSKEKILELYLNKIYLGNRAYGVGAAAFIYYGKPIDQLNLSALATIAGLPQAPSTQNPIANPIAAKKRRDHVLERLLEEKYISKQQYQQAINEPINVYYHGSHADVSAPYVAEMIRQSLYEHFGPSTYTNGYHVYTTIIGPLQTAANQVVNTDLLAYDKRHGYRGPVTHLNQVNKLSQLKRSQLLRQYPSVNHLEPAIILAVNQQTARAQIKSNKIVTLEWQNINWARKALKKGYVAKAPTVAKNILTVGDVVYLQAKDNQWQLSQIPEVQAALVALNPENGAIKALVGGFSFEKNSFNRATQSSRQPGSSFKPFLYAAALNKGYTLATLINDAPIIVDDPSQADLWRPHNDNLTFNGPTRLKEALVRSRNTVSIRILDDLGFDYVIDFVTKFGFHKHQLPRALSLALGSLSVSPMDLTAAYAIFANGGYKVQPYLIDHIVDNDGHVLLTANPNVVCGNQCDEKKIDQNNRAPQVISSDIAFLMTTALKDVIHHGTAAAANSLNRQDIAGKTGTTNDQVDAWFAGFNPKLVVTTWVGFDSPQSLHEYAASLALPMWISFMKVALFNMPEQLIAQPATIVAARIDPKTGLLATDDQPNSIIEYFREQDVPHENQTTTEAGHSAINVEDVTGEENNVDILNTMDNR